MYFEVACRLASVNARIGLHIVSLATLIYLSNSGKTVFQTHHCNSIHAYPYTIGSSNLLLSIDTRVDLLRGLFKREASCIDIQKLLCKFAKYLGEVFKHDVGYSQRTSFARDTRRSRVGGVVFGQVRNLHARKVRVR